MKTIKQSRYFTYVKPVLKIPMVRTYGTTALTIFALIIFIIFAIKPTIETIITLQKELETQKQVLKQITQKSENLTQARQNYLAIPEETKTKIEALLPPETSLPNLIKALEESSNVSQATVSAIQFQPLVLEKPQGSKTVTEISFGFSAEGEYEALQTVLQNLNESPRLISIDNLSFNKVNREDRESTTSGRLANQGLVMSVTGRAYYLK